jgi:hypothetical protein
MDINQFRASINRRGILLSNKFLVVVTPPPGMFSKTKSFRDMVARASSVSFPVATLMVVDGHLRYGHGVPERMPYSVNFSEVTADFVLSRDAEELGMFNLWLNQVFNFDTSKGIWAENSQAGGTVFEVGYKSQYATTVTIYVYNDSSDRVVEITLVDAFPAATNLHNLDWEATNAPQKLSINFAYRNYIMKTVAKLPDIT